MRTMVHYCALATLLVSALSWADCQKLADLTKMDGQVSVKPAGKVIRQTPKTLPYALCQGDEVHTFSGRAQVVSIHKDSIVVDAESVLTMKGDAKLAVAKGSAFFDIRKRAGGTPLQVSTRLTVIGVKGTRFLVADQGASLAVVMDEGVVDCGGWSAGGLKLYREKMVKEAEDFEAFKREISQGVEAQKKEFETYKEKLQREFVGYVKNVELSAGSELEIGRGQAVERGADGKRKAILAELKSWGER